VNSDTVDPGARVLWCLRRRKTDVRCVLYASSRPIEIQVLQDRDMVLRERFAHESGALDWAREYADRLKQHGWRDSPEDYSPSSAA
jgi:hypothetical protein